MVRNFRFVLCHRNPKRSFFFRHKQFPICARCTGVLIGEFIAFALIFVGIGRVFNLINFSIILLLMAVMFFDWFIQRIGLKESTNMRRLITGLFGGIGVIYTYYYTLSFLVKIVFG